LQFLLHNMLTWQSFELGSTWSQIRVTVDLWQAVALH
jgi:hypothetical protein